MTSIIGGSCMEGRGASFLSWKIFKVIKHIQGRIRWKRQKKRERVYHATSIFLLYLFAYTLTSWISHANFAKLIITYHILPFLSNQFNSFWKKTNKHAMWIYSTNNETILNNFSPNLRKKTELLWMCHCKSFSLFSTNCRYRGWL